MDGNTYHITDTVTVLGNTGTLVKTGYTFAGWNTAANGSGTSYSPSDTFAMGSEQRDPVRPVDREHLLRHLQRQHQHRGVRPHGCHQYTTPPTPRRSWATPAPWSRPATPSRGWNTAANGSGTSYTGGDTFAIGTSNVTLYAQWTANDYSVTYNGNTNTGGSVPVDGNTYHITDTVTVLGNTGTLVKTGYTFAAGTRPPTAAAPATPPVTPSPWVQSNVTLYAQWTENTYSVTYNGNSNTGGSVPTDATAYHTGDTATVLGNTGTLVRTGYTFSGWNTAANGSGTSYTGGDTFAIGTSNVTLYAQWNPVITASSGPNGSISPTGQVVVDYGADQAFTITPNTGYHVADVLVDGASVGPVYTYTFSTVVTGHTIEAASPSPPTPTPGSSLRVPPTGAWRPGYWWPTPTPVRSPWTSSSTRVQGEVALPELAGLVLPAGEPHVL